MISCKFVFSVSTSPLTTSTRRNFLSGAGTKTKSRSCMRSTADAGTIGVHLCGLAAECRLREHAEPHHSGILHFDAHLGSANAGIENSANIADLALERPIGIGIQGDLRGIAEPDVRQVILVHVADDPDRRDIGNRKRAGR